MNSRDPVSKADLAAYSVFALYVAGTRFTDDYDDDDAVEQYLELHPGSDEAAVRAELQANIKANP